jgi:hypothetical protein
MTTISASSTIGISLSTPSYFNPVIIDQGVTISNQGVGVLASSGLWTIQNSGSIDAGGTSGAGIRLSDGGLISNAGNAEIYSALAAAV